MFFIWNLVFYLESLKKTDNNPGGKVSIQTLRRNFACEIEEREKLRQEVFLSNNRNIIIMIHENTLMKIDAGRIFLEHDQHQLS